MLASYAVYYTYGAAQILLLGLYGYLIARRHLPSLRRCGDGSGPRLPLDLYFLALIQVGLVYDNLKVALSSFFYSDPGTLYGLGCATYVFHELVAPLHIAVALDASLRVAGGPKRIWIARSLRPAVVAACGGLSVFGVWLASVRICRNLELAATPDGGVTAEAGPGAPFDAGIVFIFIGSLLYIFLGACLWKRARFLPFLVAQCLLLPLFAAVPASDAYGFWFGNLWEVFWAASFVWLQWWILQQEEGGWPAVRAVDEAKATKEADAKAVEEGKKVEVAVAEEANPVVAA
ncbi:hypothetical protein DFJ74DRAFT_685451 [Hyaloraphidium curvatum]|nr:hypothetical protein DFJ74DRAFT_685451 [Hyaloraphidium curvatum]